MDNHQVIDAKNLFSQDEEKAIIVKAQQGEQQAFHQLYELYHRRMYALCWRMLADKGSAEDVCQEVFVQLWQNIRNFRGDSKFSTWLHSVATNVVLGHLRKHKNWLQKVFSLEDNPQQEACVELEELSTLDKQIMRLPERARLVFVLFAVEGYRHEEIAKMLNMAVGSSKAQYHRARNLLQDWVEV
ncbi:RNA polymerase sigma factor [Thalassotalea atypica]|uniref:RNA polymerase sigma factor n=1 Tax=Thalassotalea atypica TaxID=2054316 RepID=UPI0025730804|nr:sigma-70 family RNA polymerase sigma factor [Thalassotalea atypica]